MCKPILISHKLFSEFCRARLVKKCLMVNTISCNECREGNCPVWLNSKSAEAAKRGGVDAVVKPPTAAAAPLPVGDGGPDGFLNDNG